MMMMMILLWSLLLPPFEVWVWVPVGNELLMGLRKPYHQVQVAYWHFGAIDEHQHSKGHYGCMMHTFFPFNNTSP